MLSSWTIPPNSLRIGKNIELMLNILIIFGTIILIAYFQHHNENKNNNIENNIPSKYLSESTNELRGLINTTIEFPLMTEKFRKETQKKVVINSLNGIIYTGNWSSENPQFNIGNKDSGLLYLRFLFFIERLTGEEIMVILFKCYEDKYVDNWIEIKSFTNLNSFMENLNKNDTELEDDIKTVTLSAPFYYNYKNGQIYSTTFQSNKKCKGQANLTFPFKHFVLQINNTLENTSNDINVTAIDPSQFDFSIDSDCGITLNSTLMKDKVSYYEALQQINVYVLLASLISIISVASTILLNYQLASKDQNISAISLFTISQNVLWHSYCCMSHISFGLQYFTFFHKFCIIMGLNLFCYSMVDLRLLFTFWKIKSRFVPSDILVKSRMRFYLFFYGIFFSFFFFLVRFFYDKMCISILLFLLWTPQIISNVIKNNKIGIPFFYILISTLDRLAIPLYFRGYDDNFIRTKGKGNCTFFAINGAYILFCVIVLYLQMIFGPRFFLPQKLRGNAFDYYKTRQELLLIKPNVAEEDCVICLIPIFKQEDEDELKKATKIKAHQERLLKVDNVIPVETNSNLNDTKTVKSEDISIPVNNQIEIDEEKNGTNDIKMQEKSKCLKTKMSLKCFFCTFFQICFTFYKLKENLYNKKYMLTPCNHSFHAICLEEWFAHKKDCPNCRTEMVN